MSRLAWAYNRLYMGLEPFNKYGCCFDREDQPGSGRSFVGHPAATKPLGSHVHHASAAVGHHWTDGSNAVRLQRCISRFHHRKQTVHLCQRSATRVSGTSLRNS